MAPLFADAPLFALVTIAVSTLWRALFLARRDGAKAIILATGDDAHAFIVRVFELFVVVAGVFSVTYAVRPAFAAWLGPFAWLKLGMIAWLGVSLIGLGTALVVAAQIGMGRSWRVGIDRDHVSERVVSGLYRLSRNPIYVGMVAIVAGSFFVAPNAVTLCMLVVTAITVSIQVRLEEEYLAVTQGKAYEAYQVRTRRWL